MINKDLESLAFPVEQLDPLPGNPRKGDVEAIKRSYERFGQRKPIVARKNGKRGTVIAGNHQLEAAKRLSWQNIAVVWVDDDDKTAAAYALADNRVGDMGTYDSNLLLDLIDTVVDDPELFAATGYTLEDVDNMLSYKDNTPNPQDTNNWEAVISYSLLFDNEEQKDRFYNFLRWLRDHYEGETIAERLNDFIMEKTTL
jgi:hypothetical protein